MTNYSALPYRDYLLTEHWWRVSEERKYIDGNRCAKCGSTDRLEVHHLRYVDEFGGSLRGHEDPKLDLITLCRSCHEKVSQPVPEGPYDFTVIGAELMDDGERLKATLSVDYGGIAHSFVELMRCDDDDFTKIARFKKSIGLRPGEPLHPEDIIGLKGRAHVGVKDPQRYNQNNVINFFLKED